MKYILFFLVKGEIHSFAGLNKPITVAFYRPGQADDDVADTITQGLKKASDFNDQISDIALKFISKINDQVDDFIDKVKHANIFSKAREIADNINNLASDAIESNRNVASALLNSLTDVVQEIADVIEDIVKEAKENAKDLAKAFNS